MYDKLKALLERWVQYRLQATHMKLQVRFDELNKLRSSEAFLHDRLEKESRVQTVLQARLRAADRLISEASIILFSREPTPWASVKMWQDDYYQYKLEERRHDCS